MFIKSKAPKQGEVRDVKRFAWYPVKVDGGYVWLEWYWSKEIYIVMKQLPNFWRIIEAKRITKPTIPNTEKKMTAVSYLRHEFEKLLAWQEGHHEAKTYTMNEFCNALERAIAMEREQMIEMGNKMQLIADVDLDGNVKFAFNPTDYYNEKFGDEEN